jgi:hypothetical protein
VSLSDDLLADADRLGRIRERLEALVDGCGARAAFLVDEGGTPFAAVGNVEFRLPHPLAGFLEGNADAILAALVGEPAPSEASSGVLVERLSERALLVVVLGGRVDARARSAIRAAARGLGKVVG